MAIEREDSARGITTVVVPAAGMGTRFLPATKATPKEMLPVVDRPAIQNVVEEAIRAGLQDVLMITGRNKRALEDLDAKTARDLDAPYRATVLDPIGKLCSYFPEINKLIDKRSRKLLDYDATRSRYKKQSDRPSDDASKLPRMESEHNEAKLVFDAINEQLMTELPQLVDMRIPYLDPSLEMMVRVQLKFAQDGYEQLGGVQRYFPEAVRTEYAEGQLDAQVEGVLQEMRSLSICGMNQ